jgi:hypothetical protein
MKGRARKDRREGQEGDRMEERKGREHRGNESGGRESFIQ